MEHCLEKGKFSRRTISRGNACKRRVIMIISSLIDLEKGVIEPEDSVRTWSGEIFWNEDWNKDIGFSDAFHASCVWYFREVIDEIGKDAIQEELNRLCCCLGRMKRRFPFMAKREWARLTALRLIRGLRGLQIPMVEGFTFVCI